MPEALGVSNPRIAAARSLLSKKGRRQLQRFAFEGPTLLREALEAGLQLEAVYATPAAMQRDTELEQARARGVAVFAVDERAMRRMSDVRTPSGILAVAPAVRKPLDELLAEPGLVLALADLNDPGNAGTLLRCAEAAGATRVVFGSRGTDPHHPKVVRAAMGSLFRLEIAVAGPEDLLALSGWEVTGLTPGGPPLDTLSWPERSMLVVGNERHGLGDWAAACTRWASIAMRGRTESLNAAMAGAIALYEAGKRVKS